MLGQGKHTVHFADGPRDEKLDLRRKNGGKAEFLVKNVMSSSYRRKRDVTHRWVRSAAQMLPSTVSRHQDLHSGLRAYATSSEPRGRRNLKPSTER
eukprot:SAG31_NODE_1581_length_7834_cov_11.737298_2_plen_96_part_00